MSPRTLIGDKAAAIRALEGVRDRHPAEAEAVEPAIALLRVDIQLIELQQIEDCPHGCGIVLRGGTAFGCPIHGDTPELLEKLRENRGRAG